MATPVFEDQLMNDIEKLRGNFASPVKMIVTRWGEPSDDWVSWDVDMLVPPDKMDGQTVELYRRLAKLLNRDPYRIIEEGITPDRIGFMVTNKASIC